MFCHGGTGMLWKTPGETIQIVAVTHLECLQVSVPPEMVTACGWPERLGIPDKSWDYWSVGADAGEVDDVDKIAPRQAPPV